MKAREEMIAARPIWTHDCKSRVIVTKDQDLAARSAQATSYGRL